MNDKKLNIKEIDEESIRFFSKGKLIWKITKEENWNELADKIETSKVKKRMPSSLYFLRYAAAASVVALIGLSGLIFFYNKTIETKPGEKITINLPDGSIVDMNAVSLLKYYPLQLTFKRKLYFEGEGFFSVIKGNKFEVVSDAGKTCVLGTSFNVYSRDKKYKVTCLTGKVKVISKSDESVMLNPNNHVEIKDGRLFLDEEYKTDWALAWRNDQFFFSGTPLKEVFREIERQYGVTIKIQPELKTRNFAGNFRKKYNVEEVLDDICKTMQISYKKSSENVFLIRKNG